MASPHDTTLALALCPTHLLALHDLYFAFAASNNLKDGASILQFFDNDIPEAVYDLSYEFALKPLSEIPLSEIPPLLPYLGTPEAPDFPQRALGLCLLLDQAPRQILSGVNKHWTHDFFGVLALRFLRELEALPERLRIDRVARWVGLGYSFEAAWLRFFMTCAPWIHSEDLDDQLHGQRLVEREGRKVAESHYGISDPFRDGDEADLKDLALFSNMARTITDGTEDMSRADAIWQFCRIVRAHEPIIRVHGKYPYRNREMGRQDTEEDEAFFRLTDNFAMADEDVRRILREDADAGRVRPLQQERPSNES